MPSNSLGGRCLQVAVVLAGAALLSVEILQTVGRDKRTDNFVPEQSARNERSTPRSFVLPATPGVALEQEKRASAARGKVDIVGVCVARLRRLGYRVYGDEHVENVKVLQALIQFQVDRRLVPTGKFDAATLDALGCRQ